MNIKTMLLSRNVQMVIDIAGMPLFISCTV